MPKENYTKRQPLPLKREEKKLNYFFFFNTKSTSWLIFFFRFPTLTIGSVCECVRAEEKNSSNSTTADRGFKSFQLTVIDLYLKKKMSQNCDCFRSIWWCDFKIALPIHTRSKHMTTFLTIIIIQRTVFSASAHAHTICINVFIWENNMRSWKMKLHESVDRNRVKEWARLWILCCAKDFFACSNFMFISFMWIKMPSCM